MPKRPYTGPSDPKIKNVEKRALKLSLDALRERETQLRLDLAAKKRELERQRAKSYWEGNAVVEQRLAKQRETLEEKAEKLKQAKRTIRSELKAMKPKKPYTGPKDPK